MSYLCRTHGGCSVDERSKSIGGTNVLRSQFHAVIIDLNQVGGLIIK